MSIGPVRPIRIVAPLLISVALVSGCALNPVQSIKDWRKPDPTAPYIGRSKAEIVACAGQPFGHYQTTTGENLVYHYNGAGPVPGPAGKAKKKSSGFSFKKRDKHWQCTATFAFQNGRLASIQYAARKAESPYTENGRRKDNVPQCTFTLPNCPPAR